MSAPLRIVVDARATTEHFPGVARAIIGLLDGLQTIEHPHHIAVLSHADAPPVSLPVFSDSRFERIPTCVPPLSLAQQWQLPLLARSLRPQVWHAPYYVRPFWGIPQPIVTVFDIIGHVVPGAIPSLRSRLLFELTLRWSLRTAAHVITSSMATKRDLMAAYHVAEEMITVIPLAADARFVPQPAQRVQAVRTYYGLPPRYLLYLGSNKPHKNLTALVQAFAHVQTDAILVIAGHWDRRYEQPKRLAQTLQLGERVRFLHEVAEPDLPSLLTGALAFVFPSRYEGFGLPPLEAMACGTPVIAANRGALPEVVGNAGMLVELDPRSLARAMQNILDDSGLRQRLRERGFAQASRFSWASTAQSTVAVYEYVAWS
jgi:glycosyltransferase involved in cell wall biosynthesis